MSVTKISKAGLKDNSIDSDQYVDGSIDNAHLADDAVNSDEIASGAVDNDHMAANSVDSDQYVDGSIDNAHLADNTISGAKINSTFDISGKTVTLPTTTLGLSYTNGTATGDASTVAFTITSGRAVADVLVHVNGILMTPTTDYAISGTTLTFVTAPAASAEIDFRYLPK
jgi:hypothetical protein